MTNRSTARALVEQAGVVLEEAQSLYRGAWNLVVRRCQEVVELCLKAALRATGVEVPRLHDVGAALNSHAHRLPEALRGHVPEMAAISRRLAREREPVFYGDEDTDTPPQELYEETDARWALADAEKVVRWTGRAREPRGGPG
ncbi:MAG: HEPN domain-containing protein [Armatimonadota bacterium]|nr:HEPN domain-containing protein [Armatimonadota bacterium]MDW8155259.1 HEPN domain-containing protein [Armatimonadota bacterium]